MQRLSHKSNQLERIYGIPGDASAVTQRPVNLNVAPARLRAWRSYLMLVDVNAVKRCVTLNEESLELFQI